ncbi:MAG: TetR/AcrR family transcriptional regulator [Chloroflexi bacterium]|nr:TetR/AcrR family transcriptional regulator [Chloroflexota bacterium]
MTKRAESVDETRRQITEAAVRLHTTIGPAETSIAGVAEEAGVTRLTVYRHFADIEQLFAACRPHWKAQNPIPDPAIWSGIDGLEPRTLAALTAMYGWFADHAEPLFPIYRDLATMPQATRNAMLEDTRALADLLVSTDLPRGEAGRRLRAVARHLLDYRTWRSLAIDHELGPHATIETAVRMLLSARS